MGAGHACKSSPRPLFCHLVCTLVHSTAAVTTSGSPVHGPYVPGLRPEQQATEGR